MANESQEIHPALPAAQPPAQRSELLLVLGLFLMGLALRGAWPARMAVEHFDEGVYASNYFFSGERGDEHYPSQQLYAPPLLPVLIDLAMVLAGPSNVAPLLVSIVAGSLTIPLVWWVGRRWFSPTAGLAAAALVTFSDIHILFSRTALTDVLLCLFLLAAVHAFWVAQTTSSRVAWILAGGLTGLAWWTKYNGWLPLAIGIAGCLPWRLLSGWLRPMPTGEPATRWPPLRPLVRSLLIWAGVAVVAVAVWSGVWWGLQSTGGYGAVAANHQTYLVGWAGWRPSIALQIRKLALLSGPVTGCGPLVGLALGLWQVRRMNPRFTWNELLRNDIVYLSAPVLGLIGVIEGGGVIVLFLGVVGTLIALSRSVSAPEGAPGPTAGTGLAGWLLTAWIAGLFLTVPLYTPYPRLMLPLLLASWLGAAVLADAIVQEIVRRVTSPPPQVMEEPRLARRRRGIGAFKAKPVLILMLGAAIVFSLVQHRTWDQGMIGWQNRSGLAELAPEIRDDVIRNAGVDPKLGLDRFVIYTYGEPALMFHLRRSGCSFVKPVKDLAFAYPEHPRPQLTSYVAFGRQAWRTRGFGEQLAKALPRLQLVGKYRFQPSDVVNLDDPLIKHDRPLEYEIEVYLTK